MKINVQGVARPRVLLVLISAIAIFLYLSESNYLRSVKLSQIIDHCLEWLSFQEDEPQIIDNLVDKQTETQRSDSSTSQYASRVHEYHEAFICDAPSLGSVTHQKTKGIYSWVDEKGVKNFSDQKPKVTAKEHVFVSKDALDFFDLNVSVPSSKLELKNQVESKLYAVFRAYSELLGIQNVKRVKLDIVILPSEKEYERARRPFKVSSNTRGFYTHTLKKAFVLYRDDKSTIQTAIHEAVHAINHSLLGKTNRWLNEGSAEYFEKLETTMHYAEVGANSDWTKKGYVRDKLLMPAAIIGHSNTWKEHEVPLMYSSSWAYVHFLMMSDKTRKAFGELLKRESQDKCNVLTHSEINELLKYREQSTEDNFYIFTKSKIEKHRI
ncbi:DUF4124 domain-containing protein [Pseudoalteromonas xiamenensis]